jgi:hypothetical protein
MSQKRTRQLMPILGFAGFFSAMLAICAPVHEGFGYLLPGALFGAALSICFWFSKILNVFWKLLTITAVFSIALPLSAIVGIGVEYFYPSGHEPGKSWSEVSSAALFVGGTIGAFLLFATIFFFANLEISWKRVLLSAIGWSPVGGVLAIVGWNLGPWLGLALWSLKFRLGLTISNDRFEYALAQGRAGTDSLLLVWQMGMGFLLALAFNGQQSATVDDSEHTKSYQQA